MPTPSCPSTLCCLLPRICETVPLCPDRKCAPVHLSAPLPEEACFTYGCLNAMPALQDVILYPTHAGHGCKLEATLNLPVCLHFVCGCKQLSRTGSILLPIESLLRTQSSSALQYIPQAELCVRCLYTQDSCLCAEFDLRLCLYTVQLQPVQIPVLCPEPAQPDCTSFFHLPLYPELPHILYTRKG